MKTKTTSAKKKLIPAAAMLAVSAAMLTTATYAWFTMSKEVEVTGIQMTAVVPQGLQISLGKGQGNNQLTAISAGNGVGKVQAPENTDTSTDWSNSVAFYDFYQAPKLTPASSNTGATIYTTDDANGVGQTVDEAGTSKAGTAGELTLVSTKTVAPSTTDERADYVDFPVWIRNSDSADVQLSVSATAIVGENSSATKPTNNAVNKLYRAARVSVLTSADGSAAPAVSDGVIIPFDGTTAQTTDKYYVDGKALAAVDTLGVQGTGAAYGAVTALKQNTDAATIDGDAVVTILGKDTTDTSSNYNGKSTDSSTNYGDATCVIVRVWLEGEDEDCWNATAGQDFQVSLKFTQKTT